MQVTILNYRLSIFQFQFFHFNYQLNKFMAFRKDNKIKSNFSKKSLSVWLLLRKSLRIPSGEVLKPKPSTIVIISPNATDCSASASLVLSRITECHCGKYKRIRYKGIVCDRCGVEVTEKKCAVSVWDTSSSLCPWLIWYFRSLPNKSVIVGLAHQETGCHYLLRALCCHSAGCTVR